MFGGFSQASVLSRLYYAPTFANAGKKAKNARFRPQGVGIKSLKREKLFANSSLLNPALPPKNAPCKPPNPAFGKARRFYGFYSTWAFVYHRGVFCKMKKCTTCGRGSDDYVEFTCPACSNQKLVRCKTCRENDNKYSCPACGFKGP